MSISAAELQRLRDAHTANLTEAGSTCTIRRKTPGVDVYGGADDSWSTVGTAVCRLMPERDRRLQENVADREAMTIYYRLTVPYNTDLRADDEVIFSGDTYQVAALWDDHDLRTARRAIVAKVM